MSEIKSQYVYLLQEREFTKTHEDIFKIGKSTQSNIKRLMQYPKGSILLVQIICLDCTKCEKMIMKKFKEKYIQRLDIGNEYFEGEYKNMKPDICNIVSLSNAEVKQEILEINGLENYISTNPADLIFVGITNIIITNKNPVEGFIEYSNGKYIILGLGSFMCKMQDKEKCNNCNECSDQLKNNILCAYASKHPIIYKVTSPIFGIFGSIDEVRNTYYTYQHNITLEFITSKQYDRLISTKQAQYTCFKNCEYIRCKLIFNETDTAEKILQESIIDISKQPSGIFCDRYWMLE